jgi:hypothetical protein
MIHPLFIHAKLKKPETGGVSGLSLRFRNPETGLETLSAEFDHQPHNRDQARLSGSNGLPAKLGARFAFGRSVGWKWVA